MRIRPYLPTDISNCLSIFDGNCPKYFDFSERDAFAHWLSFQELPDKNTYSFSALERYYVIEDNDNQMVGCAGYYVTMDEKEARFAWGMIRKELQHHGIGTYLAQQRIKEIKRTYPLAEITLATSQHTHLFYAQMGFEVLDIIPSGFAPNLDKYEMKLKAN
ncbi:MAG: hypothetical protein RLZZ198_1534 [Bacteroidota bacterium]|jgi:N-acetylglutamate synthase-like GNAT family acetyltransferase